MLRAWLYLAGAIVALCLVLFSFTFAPSYKECHEGYEKAYADPEKPHSQEEVLRAFPEKAMAFAWCQGEFAHVNEGVITGFATAVIACFTITLWLIAWKQLGHAHEVDRAYLTGGGDIDQNRAGQDVFRLDIENIGRTAAFVTKYHVQFASKAQVKKFRRFKPSQVHDDRFAPAGGDKDSSMRKGILTPVTKPPNAEFVYGAVWYKDIWRRTHYFRFILRIHPSGHTRTDIEGLDQRYRKWT
jgi:hypothetical protein